jgi:hypothetical protein
VVAGVKNSESGTRVDGHAKDDSGPVGARFCGKVDPLPFG